MRRLREQQTVELDLESEQHPVSCRVTAVTGAVATLTGNAPQSPDLKT